MFELLFHLLASSKLTGSHGVLQFMGSQRVGHDWAPKLNRTELSILTGKYSFQWTLSGTQVTEKASWTLLPTVVLLTGWWLKHRILRLMVEGKLYITKFSLVLPQVFLSEETHFLKLWCSYASVLRRQIGQPFICSLFKDSLQILLKGEAHSIRECVKRGLLCWLTGKESACRDTQVWSLLREQAQPK